MADYHFVYEDAHGTTTEWDDIQRKLGNLPPKQPKQQQQPWAPAAVSSKSKAWLASMDEEELQQAEDDLDLDDDSHFLEEYRRKRLAELKEQCRQPRFGSLLPIKGPDFVREVSQAPPEVWVVVHLYKDSIPDCKILEQCLEELASKYQQTKFVKIISTECINNYPDSNLPTVLVYNNTNVNATLVGLHRFGGKRCTPEDVAFALCQVGPVLGDDAASSAQVERKVRKDFIERVISRQEQHSDGDDDGD